MSGALNVINVSAAIHYYKSKNKFAKFRINGYMTYSRDKSINAGKHL